MEYKVPEHAKASLAKGAEESGKHQTMMKEKVGVEICDFSNLGDLESFGRKREGDVLSFSNKKKGKAVWTNYMEDMYKGMSNFASNSVFAGLDQNPNWIAGPRLSVDDPYELKMGEAPLSHFNKEFSPGPCTKDFEKSKRLFIGGPVAKITKKRTVRLRSKIPSRIPEVSVQQFTDQEIAGYLNLTNQPYFFNQGVTDDFLLQDVVDAAVSGKQHCREP